MCLFNRSIIFLLVIPLTSAGLFDCRWNSTSIILASYKDLKLKIDHSNNIHVTRENIRSGNQLVINATDDVSVSVSLNGTLRIKLKADKNTPDSANTVKMSSILWLMPILLFLKKLMATNNRSLLFICVLAVCVSYTLSSKDCSEPTVHIKIPMKSVFQVCVNGNRCLPSTCDLGVFHKNSKGYSKVDADNDVLFSDQFCTIKKPTDWDEWVFNYFKTNKSTEEFYFLDSDNDGLVNILEYYADLDLTKSSRQRRNINMIGSDPTNPDTDSDLLLDGFESYNNMKPTKADDSNADTDNDNLSNIKEQIYGTDPLNADSDGDGVKDGTEVQNNADPNDASDRGKQRESDIYAMVQLTIGDPSGSHSERYNLNVGSIEHQSPDFGVVGSGIYKFEPGRYPITVRWVATNIESGIPDYDYTAAVNKVSEKDVVVKIEDPSDLLGNFYLSHTDRTIGLEATLVVEPMCIKGNKKNPPSCYKTCPECQSSKHRYWDDTVCRDIINTDNYVDTCPEESSCADCAEWYHEEKKDTKWLEELNLKYPCPCRVVKTEDGLKSANENSTIDWDPDFACKKDGKGTLLWNCEDYHPGASGCMRANTDDIPYLTGETQQCCYDFDLNWIPSGSSKGAGTPDKHSNTLLHKLWDVDTYEDCCEKCSKKDHCDYYIKDVRKGPDTCSNTA